MIKEFLKKHRAFIIALVLFYVALMLLFMFLTPSGPDELPFQYRLR